MEEEAERSSDVIDQASQTEARATAGHLAEARAKAKPDQAQNKDGSWPQTECEDCGDDIPPARLLACGSIRCVYCQGALERRRRGY